MVGRTGAAFGGYSCIGGVRACGERRETNFVTRVPLLEREGGEGGEMDRRRGRDEREQGGWVE